MKHCFIISIFYISVALYGARYASSESGKTFFKEDLHKYIKERKSEANTALTVKWFPLGGSVVNFFSRRYEKGTSVDRNELLLLTGYTDEEYKEAIAQQDILEIENFAQAAYNSIKNEKDVNKSHDLLYNLISKHNAEKLFHDKNMTRPDAIKKMLESKDDVNVKKQFVFGIAVTKTVEDMMKKK